MTTIDQQAADLRDHHKAIEALDSFEALSAYAGRVSASDYPDHIAEELMHHLERKRVEVLRKSGALSG